MEASVYNLGRGQLEKSVAVCGLDILRTLSRDKTDSIDGTGCVYELEMVLAVLCWSYSPGVDVSCFGVLTTDAENGRVLW